MNKNTLFIARMALLIALTFVIQMLGLPQPITGPFINTLLFLTCAILGPLAGVTLGIITPIVALIRGQLPPVLMPMLPFIALSNATLVLIYSIIYKNLFLRTERKWIILIPIFFASLGKFTLLLLSVRFIIPLVIGHRFPPQIEWIMAFPQLLTALGGGIIFVLLLRIFKKVGIPSDGKSIK
ncbi:ECF transporter S component [bacterium]